MSDTQALYRATARPFRVTLKGRSATHLRPDYVVSRLALWRYERRFPDHPWLTADAVRLLDGWIRPDDVGFEWGSGRSTVWLARRAARITSVESAPEWGATVRSLLAKEAVADRVDYRVEADADRYVGAIEDVRDGSLDLCLVDGEVRDRCAFAALAKLKPEGLLIIDNANWFFPHDPGRWRPHSRWPGDREPTALWSEVWAHLKDWRMIWTTNGVADTAMWTRR